MRRTLRGPLSRGLLAAGLAAVACTPGDLSPQPAAGPTTTAPTERPIAPRVEFAGCDGGERHAGTCVLGGAKTLSLWVDGEAPPRFLVDGAEVTPSVTSSIDGGWRSLLSIPAGAATLTVDVPGADRWSLRLLPSPATPALDRIVAALPDQNDPRRAPRLESALRDIEAGLATMGPFERAAALRLGTVLTWDLGHDAATFGRRALDAAIDLDDATIVLDLANLLKHMLEPGSIESSWILDLEALYASNVADGIMLVRWKTDLGLHALDIGDTGRGVEHLRAAITSARRLGLRDEELSAAARLTVVLGSHAREAERARAIEAFFAGMDDTPESVACLHAANLSNVAASFVYAKLSGGGGSDPEPILRSAIARFETDEVRCEPGNNTDWQHAHGLARANYALSAILDGRWDEAAERSRWFDGREVAPELRATIALNRAEVALARAEVATAAREIAGLTSDVELTRWREAIVRARIEEARGRRDAALAAYLGAEAIVDEMASAGGVVEGGGTELGLHAGAAGAIALLVARGQTERAAQIARASRARSLRPVGRAARLASLSPGQRGEWAQAVAEYDALRQRIAAELTTAWALPADARRGMLREQESLRREMEAAHRRAFTILAARTPSTHVQGGPGPGELWLLNHPKQDGEFVLAITSAGTLVRTIDGLAPGEAPQRKGERLLAPFDAEIALARSIKILAMGAAVDVPFHEVPWRGAPLVAHVPVGWAVDVGGAPSDDRRGAALVVADPSSDAAGIGRLPMAREEAGAVAASLEALAFDVETLTGDAATVERVLAGLGTADWFHYAGHGLADAADAWDSALPLAGEARLTVRDILTVAHAPGTVVLSGCETAAVGAGGNLSLATAFVLAGSRRVVGAVDDLADEDALDMAATLYRFGRQGDVATAFRAAILDGRARGRAWTSVVRLWSP